MSHLTRPSTPVPGSRLFLWRQVLRCGRGYMLTAIACSVLAGLLALAGAVFLGLGLAGVSAGTGAHMPFLLFLVSAGLRGACLYLAEWNGARASAATRATLRHNLYRALMSRGPVRLGGTTSGALTSILMEGVEACDACIARYLPSLTTALVVPPCALALIAGYAGWIAAVPAAGGVLLPLLLGGFGILAGRASREQFVTMTRMGSLFADRLRELPLIRTFSAAEREQARLAEAAEAFRVRTLRVLRVAFLSAGAMDVVTAGALAGAALLLFARGTDLSVALPVLLLTLEFFAPLRVLAAGYHDRATARAALDDIVPLLEPLPSDELISANRPGPRAAPSLELSGVGCTYPGRTEPALDKFSLRVEGGEFLALSGPSGSGKSTILHLLLGFIRPDSGTIMLAGQPLDLIEPHQRAAAFAWVGQQSRLFSGTMTDNIRLGRPEATDEQVAAAARAARLDDFITDLPEGLNTPVGEGGYGLSGGQAQRVALARAFLRNAPVLLLDEPTAGLDSDTAAGLLATIRSLGQGRTVLMATHDEQALQAADRVVRLGGVADHA